MWIALLQGFSLVVLVGAILFAPTYAQDNQWSTPINISNSTNGSWFPDLAVDNMGNVHVVWCETEWDEFQEGTEYLFYTRWDGQGWTEPNDLVAASPTIHRSSIAVDTRGNLYLTFLEDRPERYAHGVYFGHAPVGAADSAASWSPWRFIGGRMIGYASDLLMDRENRLHVLYTESSEMLPSDLCPRGNCADVFYRHSEDRGRTWSAPENLSTSDPGTKRIGLMVDWWGSIHAFWDEGSDRYRPDVPIGVAHAVSYDGGLSWSPPTLITSTVGVPQQVVAGFDGNGQTIIVWRAINFHPEEQPITDYRVYYQVSSDGTSWSSAVPIPRIFAVTGNTLFDAYDMGTDSSGNLHLVGAFRLFESDLAPAIYHLQWDGERWLVPERVSQGPGYPEYPRIVVENGNVLHVTWAVREFPGYYPQQINVWYSRKQVASPAWTPVPTCEPLPTPTSTPLHQPEPVVTPYPTLKGAESGLPDGLRTEQDEIMQLLVALSPELLLLFVVVVIRLRWFGRLLR